VEQQVFNVEDLLNHFVNKQKAAFNKNNIQLYIKTDIELSKFPITEVIEIETRLQQLFDETVNYNPSGEITLIAKLVQSYAQHIKVNFSIVSESENQNILKYFEILLKKTERQKNAKAITKDVVFDIQKPFSILLVEDYEMNQMVATNLLKREFENVCIDIAENGLIAIEKVKQNKYDLILMDINMPILNGIEATKKIRMELSCTTPILALSAHDFPQQIQQCFSSGMNDFIAKPINIQILKQKIMKSLLYSEDSTKQSIYHCFDYHSEFNSNKIAV